MREDEREALAARALERSRAPQTEVLVFDDDVRLTRFTHNAIHQNLAAASTFARIRAIDGERSGTNLTNDLSDAGLAAAAAAALTSARLAPPIDAFAALRPVDSRSTRDGSGSAFDAATAGVAAVERAAIARSIFDASEAEGLDAAGYVETKRRGITLATSAGFSRSFDDTACAINVKAIGSDSSGYAEGYATSLTQVDGAGIGRVAAQKAVAGRAPRPVAAGDWTVILEPPAFGELLSYIAEHFSAQAFSDGASFLSEGLGRTYAGTNVTIVDDVHHALAPGMPFDFEGTETQRVVLLDRGVGAAVVTDARYAAKLGMPLTGHATPKPSAAGPQAGSLVVMPGSKSLAQLIAETERGLLVTRFWYIRPVDDRKTIVTGMTRDGTFLVEKGQVTGGVRNLRFNQSILDALGRCELGSEAVRTETISSRSVVPAIKIDGFHFSSTTDF